MCWDEIKKIFNNLSPVTSFLAGFVAAVLVLCTIGFFILLGFLFTGRMDFKAALGNEKVAEAPSGLPANPSAEEPGSLTEPAVGAVTPISPRDHVRGADNAKVTLIEYSDFECPFCKKFHVTMKQLLEAYSGKIKWAYRHYPLNFHANAGKEAEATECAYELGGHEKFWQFADKVYERTASNGTGFALEDLPKLAAEQGLNKKAFENCLNSGKYKDYVSQSLESGSNAGIKGTPGIILLSANGDKELIKGAYPLELMKQLIDKALQK